MLSHPNRVFNGMSNEIKRGIRQCRYAY